MPATMIQVKGNIRERRAGMKSWITPEARV